MRKNLVVRFVAIALMTLTTMLTVSCTSHSLPLATITVSDEAGAAISPTFMGLSEEWGYAQAIAGDAETGVNEPYRQLLRNLTSYGSGPLIIRVGGDSTDDSKGPTQTTVRPLAELAGATNTHFYLGVNFKANNIKMAVAQAQNYLSNMPPGSVDAIEIGNEPDVYLRDYEPFMERFNLWKSQISPLLPQGAKLMGPAWYYWPLIMAHTNDFLTSTDGAVTPFSLHFYPGQSTVPHPDDWLLLPPAVVPGTNGFAPLAEDAHQHGVSFRIGEMNSLGHCGAAGISDTFQSALWTVDVLFRLADVGADGVNLHSAFNCAYDPIEVEKQTSPGSLATFSTTARPEYYGLLLFQEATGNHAHLVAATLTPASAGLSAWATVDEKGTHRLVVINKNEKKDGTIQVKIAGYTHVQVARLTADSYLATDGVTLAGQTFDGSTDGKPVGKMSLETCGLKDGVFVIPIGVTSAALITFEK